MPDLAGFFIAVDFAGHQPLIVNDVAVVGGPFPPDHLAGVLQVHLVGIGAVLLDGEHQRPVFVFHHAVNELFTDQQGQVELAQAAVFTLGFDEFQYVRVGDIKGGHLGTATAAGRGYGKAGAIKDIHKG